MNLWSGTKITRDLTMVIWRGVLPSLLECTLKVCSLKIWPHFIRMCSFCRFLTRCGIVKSKFRDDLIWRAQISTLFTLSCGVGYLQADVEGWRKWLCNWNFIACNNEYVTLFHTRLVCMGWHCARENEMIACNWSLMKVARWLLLQHVFNLHYVTPFVVKYY